MMHREPGFQRRAVRGRFGFFHNRSIIGRDRPARYLWPAVDQCRHVLGAAGRDHDPARAAEAGTRESVVQYPEEMVLAG